MRSFDQRFKERAPSALIDQLTDLPAGAEVQVRAVVFIKDTRWRWHNDFRVGMTNREVASVVHQAQQASEHTHVPALTS